MPATHDQSDIAIVGGGIGGICLALGLIKHGIKVTVYEAAKSFHEVGAGIAVGPNARKALRLISDDLWNHVNRQITRNQDPKQRHIFFNYRIGITAPDSKLEEEEIICAATCEDGQATAHRAHVLDEMVKLVPEGVTQFNKRLMHIEDLGQTKGIRLIFRDGSEATHGAVVGCDGIHSVVRKHIVGWDHPAAHAHYSGKFLHRGLIPMDKAIAALGEDRALNSNIYVGPHQYAIHFPVDHGKTMNVVPASEHPHDLHETWAGWCPSVQKLLSLIQRPDLWALFDSRAHPAPTYHKSRVCVLGDAAHATTPFQGSGAAMAMEDAYVLSELIAHALAVDTDLSVAFRAFDMVRRPRTQLLVETSQEAGRIWTLERPGVGADLEKVAENAQERFNWIFEWDHEHEVSWGKKFIDAVF